MAGRMLIYGGAGGIGSATARRLRASGHDLHLVGRSEPPLAALAAELGATCTVGDVTDADLFARVAADVGSPVDGLVFAVGTINLRSLGRLTASDLLRDFQVNALGAALAVQAALPALEASTTTPAVVLYSSVAAELGFASHVSMGLAKGAVSGLTVSLAAELAPRVRVNAIAPSLTATPLAAPLLASDAMAASLAGMHPLQRLGTADDIAALTAFLLSEEASWITGQIIGVDGGRSTLSVVPSARRTPPRR